MKRLLGLAACVLVAPALALAVPGSASAAPAGPADGLKKQFRTGYGVKVAETAKVPHSGLIKGISYTGAYQFDRSGAAASDMSRLYVLDKDFREQLRKEQADPFGKENELSAIKALTTPYRYISLKGSFYVNNAAVTETLPAGKSWVRYPAPNSHAMLPATAQTLDVLDPATLAALVKSAKSKGAGGAVGGARTTAYQGKLTVGELYEISPSYRSVSVRKPTGGLAKQKIGWKLWLDTGDLPRRVVTTLQAGEQTVQTVDTRFSGWGTRVGIKAPPAAQVITADDLAEPPPPAVLPEGISKLGVTLVKP